MISEEIVIEAWETWQRITDQVILHGEDATALEVAAFTNEQPALADFLAEASSRFQDPDAAELLYFVVLVLWKAVGLAQNRAAKTHPVGIVTASALETSFQNAERWMKGLGESAILAEKKIRDYRAYPESYLMAFAVEAILDCGDDGLEMGPEDQARALLASKAVVDALSSACAE